MTFRLFIMAVPSGQYVENRLVFLHVHQTAHAYCVLSRGVRCAECLELHTAVVKTDQTKQRPFTLSTKMLGSNIMPEDEKALHTSVTIIPWAVRLSWLAKFSAVIFTRKVGHTDLVFAVQSGFISRSVHARIQVSVCSGYNLFHPGLHPDRHTHTHTYKQHFDQLI